MLDSAQQPERLPLLQSSLAAHGTTQQAASARLELTSLKSVAPVRRCRSPLTAKLSRSVMPVQLRRGRWDEEDARGACSSGSEADDVPAVKPGNMSKREWELLQEARELEQGAFAFDKSVFWLLCTHPTAPNQVL